MDIDPKEFERIAAEIYSETSPVGIDAKKTHVLILQKLEDIQNRLAKIEPKIESLYTNQ